MEYWRYYEFIVNKKMITKLSDTEQDRVSLLQYLKEVETDFETPLSQKIDIALFSSKILKYGNVIASYDNNIIEAIVGFYCNDFQNYIAAISILSTKESARGKGLARKLLLETISICKEHSMKGIIVDSVNPIAIYLYKSLGFLTYESSSANNTTKEYLRLTL